MKAEDFILNFEGANKLLATCAEYNKFVKASAQLSEKEIYDLFLKKNNFSSIS